MAGLNITINPHGDHDFNMPSMEEDVDGQIPGQQLENETATYNMSTRRGIVNEVTKILNTKLRVLFQNNVPSTLDALVDEKLADYLNQSTNNTSVLENEDKERIKRLEETSGPALDRIRAKIDGLNSVIQQKNKTIFELLEEIKKMKLEKNCLANENPQHRVEIPQSLIEQQQAANHLFDQRLSTVEFQYDKGEQYSRLETLEFLNILFKGTKRYPEDPYEVVIKFLRYFFRIFITKRDISICHRTVIPTDKHKLGSRYIPPIYCRFVNRSLVHKILNAQKHCLRNARNEYGQPYSVKINLTLNRRLLWDDVEKKLSRCHSKWVSKNGNIFVKEHGHSRAVQITSKQTITNLAKKWHPRKQKSQISPSVEDREAEPAPPAISKQPVVNLSPPISTPEAIHPGKPDVLSSVRANVKALPVSSKCAQKCSESFPRLPIASPSLNPSQRFPPPGMSHTPRFNIPIPYSHVSNGNGYSFTPYERFQLGLGNRNCLLSPNEQRLIYQATGSNSTARQQLYNGTSSKSRSFSR